VETVVNHDFQAAIPGPLLKLLQEEPVLRRAFIVGGFVRDALLGHSSKDIDVEVFDTGIEKLVNVLGRWGRVDLVGRSFGVIKLTLPGCATVDFSLPRIDSKVAPGHRGFEIAFDESLSPVIASSRRDFTVNALFYDPRELVVRDEHGGLTDLDEGILRVVDSQTFTEDPLRVLRAMQFISRFGFRPDQTLLDLSRKMVGTYPELAKERVGEEWLKWSSKSRYPAQSLEFLKDSGWIRHFPELAQAVDVPQDPEWHPEGDVFRHTKHCCEALVNLPEWKNAEAADRIVYLLAVLLHDVGKASTTDHVMKKGRMRVVSPGHESVSAEMASQFFGRIGISKAIEDRVIPLIANHMVHLQEPTDRAVRRLAHRLRPETIEGLTLVMSADSLGRPPKPKVVPESVHKLLEHSKRMDISNSAPKPLLQGRDLLGIGYAPGPEMGRILSDAFSAQLDGEFGDKSAALAWIAERHPKST
jgi:tRNA nucleotidyltransferase (CCA-adding enzyme)